MKEKFRLHYTNLRNFGQLFSLSKETLSVMVWAMLAMIWSQSSQLPSLADEIPWRSKKPSKIQRLWRFIKNLNVIPKELALISAAAILSGFSGQIIYLTIDRTDIKDKWILSVAVSFRKRALPLVWNVLSKRGATSGKEQKDLLKELIPLLPDHSQVVLLGDREFRSVSLMRFCRRNGWDFRLRVKNDTWVRHQRKWFQLRDLPLSEGICGQDSLADDRKFLPLLD